VSEENIEIVRSSVEAWNAGDIDGAVAHMHREVEFFPLRSLLEGKGYRGPEEVRQYLSEGLPEEWDFVHVEADSWEHRGDEVVLVGTFNARAKASGIEVRLPVAYRSRVEGGRITFVRIYTNPEEALKEAGLRE
jgi:ketosteroid isomerase-like protein